MRIRKRSSLREDLVNGLVYKLLPWLQVRLRELRLDSFPSSPVTNSQSLQRNSGHRGLLLRDGHEVLGTQVIS